MIAVAIVIGVIYLVRGGNGHDSPTVTAGASPVPTVTSSTPIPTPLPTGTDTSPGPTPTAATAPPVSDTPAPPPAIVPGSCGEIYVYSAPGARNKTDAAVARFTAAGYVVKKVTAVGLDPARTTVYYSSGQAAMANAMVAAKVGVLAAAPRPNGYKNPGTVFVVVTADYS